MSRHIVVTWPKKKSLGEYGPMGDGYLPELFRANMAGEVINYRVGRLPIWDDTINSHGFTSWPYGASRPRCYMVHDGFVRGYCLVVGTCWRAEGEVYGWPEGWYIVRDTNFVAVELVPMRGFQGWRWYVHGETRPQQGHQAENRP